MKKTKTELYEKFIQMVAGFRKDQVSLAALTAFVREHYVEMELDNDTKISYGADGRLLVVQKPMEFRNSNGEVVLLSPEFYEVSI